METSTEHAEKVAADASTGHGSLVSGSTHFSLIAKANRLCQSAGVCAAVKTSKVPITVKAKTDITCKLPQYVLCFLKFADTALGQTIELLMWNG